MMFEVLSPDGMPESYPAPVYSSRADAEHARGDWCARYERQQYYKTGAGERIPYADLAARFEIVQINPHLEMLRDLWAFVHWAQENGLERLIIETVSHDLGLIWEMDPGSSPRSAGYYRKHGAAQMA